MRWILTIFFKKERFFKIKRLTKKKSLFFINFFFFKFYKIFLYKHLDFFFFRQQITSIGNIIFHSIFFKKKFLLIDDLTSVKEYNSINYFLFPNLLFFFKFFTFVYERNKTKKLFFIYLTSFLKRNKISFILFSNESFYKNNMTFFNRFKIPKIGFVSVRFFYPLLDYCFVIPNFVYSNQNIILFLVYSLIKSAYFERLKSLNNFFLENLVQ